MNNSKYQIILICLALEAATLVFSLLAQVSAQENTIMGFSIPINPDMDRIPTLGFKGDQIKVRGLDYPVLPDNMHIEKALAHIATFVPAGRHFILDESFYISCTFTNCGNKRVIIRLDREPFSENHQLRCFSLYGPSIEEYDSIVYDLSEDWPGQTIAFRNYFKSILNFEVKLEFDSLVMYYLAADADSTFFSQNEAFGKRIKEMGFKMKDLSYIKLTDSIFWGPEKEQKNSKGSGIK